MSIELLVLAHAGATLFMTGLIWFVQIVHYPLFLQVGQDAFFSYAREHQRRTTLVVAPIMLIEAATAISLVVLAPAGPLAVAAWLGLGLLIAIWLSTAFVQVPLHRRLLSGFDPQVIVQLAHSNWFRTFAWTLRAALALWMLRNGAPA